MIQDYEQHNRQKSNDSRQNNRKAVSGEFTSSWAAMLIFVLASLPGGALGYFLGGYVPPGTPNWHPVLKKISPKINTPF